MVSGQTDLRLSEDPKIRLREPWSLGARMELEKEWFIGDISCNNLFKLKLIKMASNVTQ